MIDDYIKCQLCDRSFRVITESHVKKYHNIKLSDYKLLFPDVPISSEWQRNVCANNGRNCIGTIHSEEVRRRNKVRVKKWWEAIRATKEWQEQTRIKNEKNERAREIYWNKFTEDVDYVVCRVCGLNFRALNGGHLKLHDMTTKDYKELFPDSLIVSMKVSKKLSISGTGRKQSRGHIQKRITSNGFVNRDKNSKAPNKLEKLFTELLFVLGLTDLIRFVGDGRRWVTFSKDWHKNPDFKIRGKRKVIELFGDYWHKNDDPQELIDRYKSADYECIVIWEHEVHSLNVELIDKIVKFTTGIV